MVAEKFVLKRYAELVVGMSKDAPQVWRKSRYCDLEGATYTHESGAPKGHYLFS